MGSLVAGRASGYAQVTFAVTGTLLTMIFGVRFVVWYLANWSRFNGAQSDPLGSLQELWLEVRWALGGIAIFGIGWLWALGTSLNIVRESRKAAAPPHSPPPSNPGKTIVP